MTSTRTLIWKRINTGIYEARIGNGQLDRYTVERIGRDDWSLTYPGEDMADGSAWTKGQAVDWANDHHAGGS